ncbi:MAG TPA: ubiquinol-cytochrome c reductase iron-sulfur subunit [Methylomirabilota bacterium]|nr:ubiquinol-cytochrome c reductase iron-sulfur subunit [Methylomirabilota bacterium]
MVDQTGNGTAQPPRRRFVEVFLGTGILASLASFLYPVFRFLIPPQSAELASDTVLAGKVGDLKPNTGKVFRFGNHPALLIMLPDGKYNALTAVCTHLGCTVQYRPDLHNVWCACHNGMYDVDGRNLSGPPPRPLESFDVFIKGDEIYVQRQRNA